MVKHDGLISLILNLGLDMAKPSEKLAESLEILRSLQQRDVIAIRSRHVAEGFLRSQEAFSNVT